MAIFSKERRSRGHGQDSDRGGVSDRQEKLDQTNPYDAKDDSPPGGIPRGKSAEIFKTTNRPKRKGKLVSEQNSALLESISE